MKQIIIFLIALIIAVPAFAESSAHEGEDKKTEETKSESGLIIIEGVVEEKTIHPLIEKMRKGLEDYEIVAERIRKKEQAERIEKKRLQQIASGQQKKYKPRTPDVSTEDILNSLEEMGIPRESINVEGQDLHDYILKFVCDGKTRADLFKNQNFTKEELKEKIKIECY